MAADGTGIIENDLAYDVHDAFFERYDGGVEPAQIKTCLITEFDGELLSADDHQNFLAALAECLWSVGQPVDDLKHRIEELIAVDAGADFWGELYPKRKSALSRFLKKTSKPKRSPVKPKKARLPKRLLFEQGDYLAFTKRNGRVVPVIVWYLEKHPPLRYDFVFPNLSKANDTALIERFLRTEEPLSDDALAVFFTKGKRPKAVTLEHSVAKHHADSFRKFGNRPFRFPVWQVGTCGYCVRFEDFQLYADEGGSRPFSADELRAIGLS